MKTFVPRAAGGTLLFLACLGVAPAQALSPVTYVSGKGTDGSDTGTCASPANPCRSFQFAISKTSAGGEVKALDPADYGSMVITKSISISGVEGAGIDRNSGDAILIKTAPNDVVNLSHLILDGNKAAKNGIRIIQPAGSLTIAHCTVRNFTTGLFYEMSGGTTNFLIRDTLFSDNSGDAIFIAPLGKNSAQGVLNHVLINNNGDGLHIFGFAGVADILAIDSSATNNVIAGFDDQSGTLRLAHSTAKGNGIGVSVGDKTYSSGDNFINGNVQDISGTLINAGTH